MSKETEEKWLKRIGIGVLAAVSFMFGLAAGEGRNASEPVVPGRYVQFGQTTVLLDTAKGEICDLDPTDPVLPICNQFRSKTKPSPKQNDN